VEIDGAKALANMKKPVFVSGPSTAPIQNEMTSAETRLPRRRSRAVAHAPVASLQAESHSSAHKSFMVLETVVSAQRPLSVSDLTALMGVPTPTMHRIVRLLDTDGFLQREPGSRLYSPGPRLVGFALDTIRSSMRSAPRHAVLERLSGAVRETCNFGMLVGNHIAYLDRVEAAWPLGLKFESGSRVPIHCTSMGKLLLSMLPRRRREELLKGSSLMRYTENTITEAGELARKLEEVRKQGYAIDNQEFLAGVVCIAAPVRDKRGTACAAVAISAPLARMSAAEAVAHLPALFEAAEELGHHLSHE
jgi:IclR family acetate operon transcriptional repressor